MRIVVFGASGATGRLLTGLALQAGHQVTAAMPAPREFPLAHGNLTVAEVDVHDRSATADAIDGADVVLSTVGVPFSRKPISVYSDGIASITSGMQRHGLSRVVVVSSAGTEPARHADGGFLLNRVVQPVVTATLGRTTYADMRRMEQFLRAGSLEWTVMRPGGLFDAGHVSEYELRDGGSDRVYTSRIDLAASMLDQAASTSWIRRCVAVNTVAGTPSLIQMLRREAIGNH